MQKILRYAYMQTGCQSIMIIFLSTGAARLDLNLREKIFTEAWFSSKQKLNRNFKEYYLISQVQLPRRNGHFIHKNFLIMSMSMIVGDCHLQFFSFCEPIMNFFSTVQSSEQGLGCCSHMLPTCDDLVCQLLYLDDFLRLSAICVSLHKKSVL